MHAPGRINRSFLGALALATMALVGCSENLAPKTIQTPGGPMASMGTVIVDVNLKTGVVTTHPAPSGSFVPPSGVSAALYGSNELIGHRFQLENGAPTGSNEFFLRDHIENLQPFSIGTHIPHAAGVFPQDTMGVYVFLSFGPFVTSGCVPNTTTCTVTLDSAYDGEFSFTSGSPQPYMFFKTILEPNDNTPDQGLDFTDQSPANGGLGIDYFRRFGFNASSGVTNIKFGVSVSAAWVKPNETSWTVHYAGDSLPNRIGTTLDDLRSEPDWRVVGSTVADTSIAITFCPASSTCLSIRNAAPASGVTDSLLYYRSDSLGQADSAFIDANIAMTNMKPGNPSVYIGMQDPVKQISFGISSNTVGFVSGANTFIPGGSGASASLSGEFRVAKFASDSVVGYVNGAKKAKLLYSALPPVSASTPTQYFWFGNRVTFATSPNNPTNVTSNWSSVVYAIGATGP